ncbi:MAG: hypothetical protein Q9219_004892 [cf. Caloplaca sp. 3 TL-2023]
MPIELNDNFNDLQIRTRGQTLPSPQVRVDAILVNLGQQTGLNQLYDRLPVPHYAVSMHPPNAIECRGCLPTSALPPPFQMSAFSNLTASCAVVWSGGNREVNAGGYCRRSTVTTPSGHTTEERTVRFSDELTPRHSWAWSGNFPLAAIVRTYCASRCECRHFPNHGNATAAIYKPWPFGLLLGEIYSVENPDGSTNLEDPKTKTSKLQLLPPLQVGPDPPPSSGTCGSETECAMSWPTDLLGPIPRAPPNATQIVSARPAAHELRQCGSFCARPQDCHREVSDNQAAECHYTVPSPRDARTLGLDLVAPPLLCLALGVAVGGVVGRDTSTSRS